MSSSAAKTTIAILRVALALPLALIALTAPIALIGGRAVAPAAASPAAQDGVSVRVVNGDLVVARDGIDHQITHHGHNAEPLLSPDGRRIAYLSVSQETLRHLEAGPRGYVPFSRNVWVIDIDGINPVQVTHHVDFADRGALHWVDSRRLVFADGEQSVRVYSLDDGQVTTVLGPETTQGKCVDACGYEIRFLLSPNRTHLVRLVGGLHLSTRTTILDLATLHSLDLAEDFLVDFESVTFTADPPSPPTISFLGQRSFEDQSPVRFTIDLTSGDVRTESH